MSETRYYWSSVFDCVLQEKDGSGNTQVTYTHEPSLYGPLVSERRNGVTSQYHFDALGSTRALTNDAQAVTDAFTYDAWGNEVTRTGTTEMPFRWIGEWGYLTSTKSNTTDVRRRDAATSISRWTSPDPLRNDARLVFGTEYHTASYSYCVNNPATSIDPAGLDAEQPASWRANMVAKSFINGIPVIGAIAPPWRTGILNPPFWLIVKYGLPIATATQRLWVLASVVGRFDAFNQNPLTDAKDQTYRLYTRVDVVFKCCNNTIQLISVDQVKEGGQELPFVYGTINMSLAQSKINDSCYLFEWKGWGSPNVIVEPGMQWVATRTSVNIWHEPRVQLCCKDGQGTYTPIRFAGSIFPSRRLWINSARQADVGQAAFARLWDLLRSDPSFVTD